MKLSEKITALEKTLAYRERSVPNHREESISGWMYEKQIIEHISDLKEDAQLEADLAKTSRAMQAAIDAGVMALAENEALREKNNDFHNALSDIADTSPNWMMSGDAIKDSEHRMRKIAQDALLTEMENDQSSCTNQ